MAGAAGEAGKGLLSVEAALGRLLGDVAPLPAETVPLDAAAGRVLAGPVLATLTQPPFDASAMDGYAVRAADVARPPVTLSVIGEAAAGRGHRGAVGPGEAVRISTGAPLPEGADAIVIQENARREGDRVTVLEGRPEPGHVRRRGLDFTAGDLLLAAPRRLSARDVTLAAAAGHASLDVRRRPRVALLATGDELVMPGTPPGRDQIVCSNPFGLAAMVRAAGGEPAIIGIAPDDRAALDAHISRAAGADILVTIGGASVGDHDLVAPVLAARGMTLDFWKIAMRPGKPLMYGGLGRQRVLGLPGNPVSSLICGRVFLWPLIEAMLGLPSAARTHLTAIAAVPLEANGPRKHYMRATLGSDGEGRRTVRPVRSQDSSLLAPLAAADALIVRDVGAPAATAGSAVAILPLDF